MDRFEDEGDSAHTRQILTMERAIPTWVQYLAEIALILAWSIFLGRDYLGTAETDLPHGGDFPVSVYGRFFWDHVRSCGLCALWDGDLRGGAPAYIDPGTDAFHPLVAIPLALLGTLEGSKVAVPLTLFLGGFASWWLAKVLGTSGVARMATGLMGAAAGHLTGRFDFGLVVLATSIATAALLLPAVITVANRPEKRATATLGVALALTALSGQAYVQIGVLLLMPSALLLAVRNDNGFSRIASHFAAAASLGALLAAPFLLPFVRFYDQIDKQSDPSFSRAQPLRYVPVNLVVSDPDFYRDSTLGKVSIPGLNVNYVGWIPIVLAMIGFIVLLRKSWQTGAFLLVVALGAVWLASAMPFRWLVGNDFSSRLRELAADVRTPSNIANLAVPAILGLAAVGIDACMSAARKGRRARIVIWAGPRTAGRLPLLDLRIAVVGLLIFSLVDLKDTAAQWLGVEQVIVDNYDEVLVDLKSSEMRWIDVPKTETRLIPLGLDSGFKLANIDRPWEWKNRLPPDPAIIVSYKEQPPGSSLIKRSDAFLIFISNEGNHYATVMGESPADSNCVATGEGGKIDVDCGAPEGGRLFLAEHYHPAWEATVNDETVQVHDEGTWLAVDLPGGPSHISLRYRPNDFWIGLGLSIIGLIWALAWLVSPRFSVIRTVRERRRIGLKPGQDSQSLV